MSDEHDDLLDEADGSVHRLIAEMRVEADRNRFDHLAEEALAEISAAPVAPRWSRQAVAAIAASAALVIGFSGAAVAAQNAVPGDLLYPLDQALEVVGLGDGGASERIEEARSLADQSRFDRGLRHAAGVLSDHPEAQSAVAAAADRVEALAPETLDVEVGYLLDYLSANVDSVDGQTVAELARSIGADSTPGSPPAAPGGGRPEDAPGGGRPEDVPGGAPPADAPAGGGPPADGPGGGQSS